MYKGCARDVEADVYCSSASISDVQVGVQRMSFKEAGMHIPRKWMCLKLCAGALKNRVLHGSSSRNTGQIRRKMLLFPRMHIHY